MVEERYKEFLRALSVRAANTLKNADVVSFKDLKKTSYQTIKSTPNCGKVSIQDIHNTAAAYGVHLDWPLTVLNISLPRYEKQAIHRADHISDAHKIDGLWLVVKYFPKDAHAFQYYYGQNSITRERAFALIEKSINQV